MLPYTISRISSWEVKLSETKPWMLNILCGECVYIYIYINIYWFEYNYVVSMGAAGHLRVLLSFCFFCCVFLFLFDDGVGSGGMVTFIFMLRWWCYLDHGVGWGGMLTFMFMLHWWRYVDHRVGWGGVGWDVNVDVHVTLMMLRWSWGRVEC